MRLIFSAVIDQFAISECLLSVNERNLFPCCHQSHYRPTLRHSWPPAPASVSPSTGHFVSHPGVTPGPITSCMVTTHTRVPDIRLCSVQQTLSPPALACLSSLSTHHQHHHQHGPVSGTSGLCHKHQCAWDTGTWCHLEQQRQRQWLPGAGECEL